MKTPALICLCFQALAEALKTNASVTNITLSSNQVGDEGVEAWCVMGSAESLNAAACHDVMFSTSCDTEKFGWFAGAVV
jgi:Ran GTPase-activating protein (RanGAP) involved in mRNA processing and transport